MGASEEAETPSAGEDNKTQDGSALRSRSRFRRVNREPRTSSEDVGREEAFPDTKEMRRWPDSEQGM